MSVEQVYDGLAVDALVAKVEAGQISEYVRSQYNACRGRLPNNIGLTDFAAKTSNWNPNKGGIGQKAQLHVLRRYDRHITKTKERGEGSIKLSKSNDGTTQIIQSGLPSTIKGVKNFDAIREYDDVIRLFVLKTIDIGTFSVSQGGGHQDNVAAEIDILAEHTRGKRFVFNGKRVEIVVLVDGRSGIIAKYADYNSANFVVSNTDAFCQNH